MSNCQQLRSQWHFLPSSVVRWWSHRLLWKLHNVSLNLLPPQSSRTKTNLSLAPLSQILPTLRVVSTCRVQPPLSAVPSSLRKAVSSRAHSLARPLPMPPAVSAPAGPRPVQALLPQAPKRAWLLHTVSARLLPVLVPLEV